MSISSLKLDISQENIYNLGETIDLILQIDQSVADQVGSSIQVDISDIFGNIVDTINAELIQDNVFAAEYTIPFNLADLYNTNNGDDTALDSTIFYLKDVWTIQGSTLEYQILVNKVFTDSPIRDNSKITVSIDGLLDKTNNLLDPIEIEFTTKLTPYYGNVDSIKSYYRQELNSVANIDIAYDIIEWSKYVDLHMRPSTIVYPDVYNNAVREYINVSIARTLLLPILNTTSEEKQLDTLRIKRESSGGTAVLNKLEELSKTYENRVYSGGLDTPYIPKLFTKGVLDPNRPNISRANLDTHDVYPWVNKTTACTNIEIDGQTVEIRGTRTVQFRSPVYGVPQDGYSHGIEVSF